jgi:hypothetical protein
MREILASRLRFEPVGWTRAAPSRSVPCSMSARLANAMTEQKPAITGPSAFVETHKPAKTH